MSLTLCDVERTNMIGTNAQEKFKMGKIFTDLSVAEYWELVRDILHGRQGSHLKLRSHFSFSQQESVTYLTQWESSHLKTSNNQVHLDLAAANESRPFWDLLWKSWKISTLFFHWRLPLIGLHANEDYFLCVHIWTNLVRNVLSIFRHFNIQPGYQQGQRHLREDIQKKTAERVKMVSWGEGQKNYWIFIIYKWWKTWGGLRVTFHYFIEPNYD